MIVPDFIARLRPPGAISVGPDVWAFDREVPPLPGDICVAEFMDRDRDAALVVVLDVALDEDARSVPVALATADVLLATDNDLIVLADDCGMSYDILIRADLVAPLFVVQVGAALGHLSDEALADVKRAAAAGPSAIPMGRRGPRLSAYSHDRLPAKEADAALLIDLSRECLDELLEPTVRIVVPNSVTDEPGLLSVALERGAVIADEGVREAPAELVALGLADVYLDATTTMIEAFATSDLRGPGAALGAPSVHPEQGSGSAALQADVIAGVLRVGRASVSVLSAAPTMPTNVIFARIAAESGTGSVQAVIENV